jgi:hypothetical protein
VIEIEKPPTGSAISRQVSRGTDDPMRIFLIPFFPLATFVIL